MRCHSIPSKTMNIIPIMHKGVKDLTGQRFGCLVVISFAYSKGKAYWNVVCDCGCKSVKNGGKMVIRASSFQCCSHKCPLFLARISNSSTRHGVWSHPLYRVWVNMNDRCSNPKYKCYKDYGGRGIHVCAEWKDSVNAFIQDMGPTWVAGLQLDRINNNEGYSPANCQWVTRRENMANRRNSVLTAVQISTASHHGISISALRRRIKRGWPIHAATTQSPAKGKRSPYSK